MMTRVLRGEFPARVRIRVPLTLIVTISEQGDTTGLWSQLRAVAAGSEVTLVCSAAGFDLRSDMQVKIAVPAAGDSDPVRFELAATQPGPRTITVRAFAGSSYLGSLPIHVTVDTSGQTEPPAEHYANLSRREYQEGEVTLEIEYDEDKRVYTYRWRDGTFVPDVCFRNAEQLKRSPIDVVDGIVQGLNNLARGVKGYSPASAEEWLKNQGIGLWQSLFPDKLQAQFRENWDKITRLSIISKNDMIPWELVYASDKEGELGYLAEHFPIARLPQHGVPPGLHFASANSSVRHRTPRRLQRLKSRRSATFSVVVASMSTPPRRVSTRSVSCSPPEDSACSTSLPTIRFPGRPRSTRSPWETVLSTQASSINTSHDLPSSLRRRWSSSTPAAATARHRSTRAWGAGRMPSSTQERAPSSVLYGKFAIQAR